MIIMRSVTISTHRFQKILFSAVFALILFSATTAQAHKVNIFAYVDGTQVYSESYFPDGRPCVETAVYIENSKGEKLLEGKTDSDGIFIFDIPEKTDLVLVLDAGMGHRAEYKIPAFDLPDIKPAKALEPAPEKEPVPEKKPEPVKPTEKTIPELAAEQVAQSEPVNEVAKLAPPEEPESEPADTSACSEEELKKLVDEAVNKKLKPIIKSLEKQQEPGISEILGGLGFIIGLAGMWLYFKGKTKKA